MIKLRDVSLSILEAEKERQLLRNVSFDFDQPRMAFMEADPKVRAALINLLSQHTKPQSGHISWEGRLSWPVGRAFPFRSGLTGMEQIDFFCTMYDLPKRKTIDLVSELIDEPDHLRLSFINWPSKVQLQFAYAIALAPQFDIYLFDGSIRLAFNPFYDRWRAAFEERIKGRMLILATGQPMDIPRWCNKGVELKNFNLTPVDNIIEKATALRMAPITEMQEEQPANQPEEEDHDLF